LLIPAGPMDQSEFEKRPDVLVFQTEPLEEPVQVIGRITVKLWASSLCVDTDFVAKLMDVYPDGRSMLIADGIIRTKVIGLNSISPVAITRASISIRTPVRIIMRDAR